MAAYEDPLAEELKCPICTDFLNDPKALHCLHRFCRDCLKNHIQGRTNCGSSSVSCPVCRQESRVSGVISVDSFVTDVGVRNVVQALKKKREDMILCDSHTGNPVVLYCRSCQKAICHVCSGIYHRGCEGVVSLQTFATEERNHVTRLLEELKTKIGTLEKANEDLKHKTEVVETRRHVEIQTVRRRFAKVHYLLNLRQEQLINEIDKEFGKAKKRYQSEEGRLRDAIRYIENSLTKTDIQLFYQHCQRRCRPVDFKFDKPIDVTFDKKIIYLMKKKLSDIELLLTPPESRPPKASPVVSRKRTCSPVPNYIVVPKVAKPSSP
ncbi:tripartite motif-containing protein 12A-like [Haliotis asinina]|uniref:tripartite motif-containing protein 12A-like n=1 Tax=Haliotis asinina TaxID=109174 RepID=UPI003531CFB8